jgi:glutathione synthase/RimK-type ligase-like ATP-grasp enzyme
MVNPPEHGVGVQLKTYQLAAARRHGLEVPRTLVTNQPERVRAFAEAVDAVVYKPSMGGDLCRPLDAEALSRLHLVKSHPVIFQERLQGMSVRATLVGSEVVSCVAISTDALDYRNDPGYVAGAQQYVEVEPPTELCERLRGFTAALGLTLAGVDFIATDDGRYVYLEANSSPSYLDIEEKTGAPISERIATCLLKAANRQVTAAARRAQPAFIHYASPFDPLAGAPT